MPGTFRNVSGMPGSRSVGYTGKGDSTKTQGEAEKRLILKKTINIPVPKYMKSRYYGWYLTALGVIAMLCETLLAVLAFIAQSWIPAALCIAGILLSVILQRVGNNWTKNTLVHHATMQGYLELDNRRKSEYN
jgi:predicted phage tail protein